MTAITRDLVGVAGAPVSGAARVGAAEAVSTVTRAARAGASRPDVTALAEVAASLSTPPEAPVPGTSAWYAAPWSALLTATAAAGEAEGAALGAGPAAPRGDGAGAGPAPGTPARYADAVVPAALAVAAEQGLRLDAVADAVAAGLDVAGRVGALLGDALGAFDRVAAIGHLAAVAAAGRLLGLAPDAAAHAYGIAGTQAAGFAATATGPVGALQIGKAAYDAVEAAYLAGAGYTAGRTGIEGRRGFAALLAPSADLDHPVPTTPPAHPGPAELDLSRTVTDFLLGHPG